MVPVQDFDAFWVEADEATMSVRFEGHDYEAPASPPASAVLRVIRLGKDTDNLAPEEAFPLAESVIGADNLKSIMDNNPSLSLKKLMAFVGWVAEKQSGATMPPPNRASRRKQRTRSTSSNGGHSLKPTSNGSITSISASRSDQ